MSMAVFLFFVNTLFLGIIGLLWLHRLIGLLTRLYGFMWALAVYLFLLFSPASFPFLTGQGIVVLYGHFVVVFAASLLSFHHFTLPGGLPRLRVSIAGLYFSCLALAAFGIGMVIYTTDVWTFYIQNQLAELRGDILDQQVSVNRVYKLMGNMVYPLAVMAPLYYFRVRRHILVLLVVIVLGALLSFSNGGKGNLLLVVILLAGSCIYFMAYRGQRFSPALKRWLFAFSVLMLVFFYLINATRVNPGETFSVIDFVALFNAYFTGSIPAFCQWLAHHEPGFFHFDMGQLAIFRELGGFAGLSSPRTIDQYVVNVPQRFNVYTAPADSLSAFGYLGSLLYYFFIGLIFGWIDRIPSNDNKLFLFTSFFLFTGYGLFTDVFFYMIGSWICLCFYFVFKFSDEPA